MHSKLCISDLGQEKIYVWFWLHWFSDTVQPVRKKGGADFYTLYWVALSPVKLFYGGNKENMLEFFYLFHLPLPVLYVTISVTL